MLGGRRPSRAALSSCLVAFVAGRRLHPTTGPQALDLAAPPSQRAGASSAAATPSAPVGTPPPKAAPSEAAPGKAALRSAAMSCVARLPQDVRIGQTMLVTTYDLARVAGWLGDGLIAGVLANGAMTERSAGAHRDATTGPRYGALLASDEEGGQVQRYADLIGYDPVRRSSRPGRLTAREVRRLYRRLGTRLADWGVDLVLAPVVDVGLGPGIGSRAYSATRTWSPSTARPPPGVSRRRADTGAQALPRSRPGHRATPTTSGSSVPTIDELRATDLVPFERDPAAVPRSATMVGHTTIPGYSHGPSSQSPAMIDGLLRDELRLRRTGRQRCPGHGRDRRDDQGDALVGFLEAGGDLGIVGPYGSVEGRRAVRAALADGDLHDRVDEAAARVLAAKGIDPCKVLPSPTAPPARPWSARSPRPPVVTRPPCREPSAVEPCVPADRANGANHLEDRRRLSRGSRSGPETSGTIGTCSFGHASPPSRSHATGSRWWLLTRGFALLSLAGMMLHHDWKHVFDDLNVYSRWGEGLADGVGSRPRTRCGSTRRWRRSCSAGSGLLGSAAVDVRAALRRRRRGRHRRCWPATPAVAAAGTATRCGWPPRSCWGRSCTAATTPFPPCSRSRACSRSPHRSPPERSWPSAAGSRCGRR